MDRVSSHMTNQPPILGPRQRKFAGFTITLACLAFLAGLIVFTIQIFSLLVSTFSSLLWPLAVAGILALMLRPLVLQFQIRLKISPVFSVILLYGIVAVASVGILAWILPILIEQIRDFAIMLPDLLHKALLYLQENLPNWAETFRGKSEQHAFI